MKTKVYLWLALIVMMFALASCQKDQNTNPPTPASQGAMVNPDAGNPQLKISSSTILNATSASQIPSQFFKVDQIYKNSYIHLKQRPAECSWTSYVMCVGSVARANNKTYSTSLTQVSTVRDRCNAHAATFPSSSISSYGDYIGNLDWYAGAYDNTKITRQFTAIQSNSGQFAAIKQMLAHINTYHTPFVVRSSINGEGHYRVVFSIDWRVGQTNSVVYYTDCNLPSGVAAGVPTNSGIEANLQSMDLTQFMSLMIVGANNYNMLFIRP